MGSLGIGEILLILVVGFLILGPEKLPKLMKNIGKALGQLLSLKEDLKDSLNDVKDSFNDTIYKEKTNFDNIKIKKLNKNKKKVKNNNVK